MHLEIFFFYNMHLDFATCQHVIESFQNKASRNFKRSHRDILKDLIRAFQNMSLTIDIPKYSNLRGILGEYKVVKLLNHEGFITS